MKSKSTPIYGATRRAGISRAVLTTLCWAGACCAGALNTAQAQTPAEVTAPPQTAAEQPAVTPTPAAPAPPTAAPPAVSTPPTVAPPRAVLPTEVPLAGEGTADDGLTLEESILLALRQHGDIGAAQQSYISAREGITSARSGLFPEVTANLNYDYQNNNSVTTTDTNTGTVITRSRIFSSTTSNVNISQNLFDGGRVRAQVKQARARALGAVGGVGSARNSLAYEVAQRFYEQLRQEKLTAQREGQVRLAQQQLEQIQAQVEAGVAARSDVQSVQVNLSQARLDLSTAQNNYRVATTTLRNTLGLGRGTALKLRESDEVRELAPQPTTPVNLNAAGEAAAAQAPAVETPAPATEAATANEKPLPITVAEPMPLPTVPDLAPLNTYVREARNLRPDIVQARANVASSEQSVALAKIQSRPQVTANAGYNIDPRSSADRGFVFGAGISIPIFDSGGRKADVRASQADLEADRIRLTQLEKDVESDVEGAYVDIAGQVDRISNARDLVESARVNLDTAIEKYRAGIGIVLDIVNAQTQLFNAETSATQAVYDYEIAKSNLDRAVGRFAWADPGQVAPETAPAVLAVAGKK